MPRTEMQTLTLHKMGFAIKTSFEQAVGTINGHSLEPRDCPSGALQLSEPHVMIIPTTAYSLPERGVRQNALAHTIAGLWLRAEGTSACRAAAGSRSRCPIPTCPPARYAQLHVNRTTTKATRPRTFRAPCNGGLKRLATSLDPIACGNTNSGNDKRRILRIVELLLHRLARIVLDDIGELKDSDKSDRIAAIFREDLENAAVSAIETREVRIDLFARTLSLTAMADRR